MHTTVRETARVSAAESVFASSIYSCNACVGFIFFMRKNVGQLIHRRIFWRSSWRTEALPKISGT